jgi:hypothetical protein
VKLRSRIERTVLLLAVVCAGGCGWPGPPLPPSLQLPKPINDLRATRKGNNVTLTWTVPARTTEGQIIHRQGPTRICRNIGATVSECANPVGEVAPQAAMPATKEGKPVTGSFTNTLAAALMQQNPTAILTYAVTALNDFGRTAGLSNQVQVPAAPTLPPPANFRGEVNRDGMLLSWSCPVVANIPSLEFFLRIYRQKEGAKAVKLADVDLKNCMEGGDRGSFDDRTLEWEQSYTYRATAVSQLSLGKKEECPPNEDSGVQCRATAEVEGEDTPEVKIFAHDIYPPSVPAGLQAVASGVGQPPFIDLIWSPVAEVDLAGYNLYRRKQGGAAVKINSELVKVPAYRDSDVKTGLRYSYSVTSVDARGNESARSEEASEALE